MNLAIKVFTVIPLQYIDTFLAGIYIHIPFCKQACHYCDFHFSTNLAPKTQLVESILSELSLRKEEISSHPITSIYFGGGTPSLLTQKELSAILNQCYKLFHVDDQAEITLEANPDDINGQQLDHFKKSGINRISLGVQTFDNERLKFINRAHTEQEAIEALQIIKDSGFNNVTADLIYAIPLGNMDAWESDLEKMLAFDLPHLSIYGLTIEDKTVFGNWAKNGEFEEVPEEVSAEQYLRSIEMLTAQGYEHYEISNFAKPGMYSRHNSAYWDDQIYLGVGPGAHSYFGETRSNNIRNNTKYIQSIERGEIPNTIERLSKTDKINEYLFTHLRTKRGINIKYLQQNLGIDIYHDHADNLSYFIKEGLLIEDGECLLPTTKGFMLADEMSLRLFYGE